VRCFVICSTFILRSDFGNYPLILELFKYSIYFCCLYIIGLDSKAIMTGEYVRIELLSRYSPGQTDKSGNSQPFITSNPAVIEIDSPPSTSLNRITMLTWSVKYYWTSRVICMIPDTYNKKFVSLLILLLFHMKWKPTSDILTSNLSCILLTDIKLWCQHFCTYLL
jgi:hypothetical protein